VIAVADAIAYAHEHHVIHRDLKPHNVMIGDFGETVVIDWGLAKDLRDRGAGAGADADADSWHRDDRAQSGETVAGSVLGTPADMPPEQARGLAVDERADVYAISAVLYHVLNGQAPFSDAEGADDVLARLRRGGAPTPLAALAPAAPPDLLAIVAKAMTPEAAGRYPTAKQLAEDLRRFQAGQLVGAHRYSTWQRARRWVARHRGAVAVAAIAIAVGGTLGALAVDRIVDERRAAERARARAEDNRADAEELVGFMLTDLHDKLSRLDHLE